MHHAACPCSICVKDRPPLWWLPKRASFVLVAKGEEVFPFEEIERQTIRRFGNEAKDKIREFMRDATRGLGKDQPMTRAHIEKIRAQINERLLALEASLAIVAVDYAKLVADAGAKAGIELLPDGTMTLADLRDRVSPQVQAAAERTATRMARSVSQSVARSITDIVRTGVDENLTTQEVANLIRDEHGFDASRAETIARTESARAFGEGQI